MLHRELVDRWIKTNDKMAFQMIRRLNKEEGILSGGSSGAAIAGALIAAKDLKAGQRCVVVLPDGIRNYMTKFVTDNWLEARHFKEIENEHNHWWWDYAVTNIGFTSVKSIQPNTKCTEALNILKSSESERLAVADENGYVSDFFFFFDGIISRKSVPNNCFFYFQKTCRFSCIEAPNKKSR